jgi:hypothetical protein
MSEKNHAILINELDNTGFYDKVIVISTKRFKPEGAMFG